MKVADIIGEFDRIDRKGFDFYEICRHLKEASADVKESQEFRFEYVG